MPLLNQLYSIYLIINKLDKYNWIIKITYEKYYIY